MNPRTRLLVLTLLALVAVGLPAPPSAAQFAVFDGANFTQNSLTALREAQAILQRIEQIRRMVEELEYHRQTLEHRIQALGNPTSRGFLGRLRAIEAELAAVTRGITIGKRQLHLLYEQLFGDLEPEDLRGTERDRLDATLETIEAGLLYVANITRFLVPTQEALGTMKRQALDAEGDREARQAQAQLLAFISEELALIEHQLATQLNLYAVVEGARLSGQATAVLAAEAIAERAHVDLPPYGATEPLPTLPASYPRLSLPGAFRSPRGGR